MDSKIKILYIDDEQLNLTAFVRLFRRQYDITTASSAKEGGEILKDQQFHVILVDQRMPGTTGSEFFKEIAITYPDSMRVLVTAYSDLQAVISAVNDGKIYKYISKPYKKEEMIEVIESAYQTHHTRTVQDINFSKYKEVFTNSEDAIFLISKKGLIVDVNDTCLSLLGASRDHLINKEAENLFDRISMEEQFLSASCEYNTLDDVEATCVAKPGEVFDCLVSFKEISIEGDELAGYQGTIKNISKYKKSVRNSVRNLLEQKEREKEDMVKVLHENSAQNLSGIQFQLSMLEKTSDSQVAIETINEVKETLVDTINELREVCFQILPESLSFGVSDALENLSQNIEVAYQAKCEITVEDDLSYMSKDFKVMIFRTIQGLFRGLQKENSTLFVEIGSDDYCIYSEVTGKKLEESKEIIDQVMTEVDCYEGTMTEQYAMDDQTCYRMVFPVTKS